LFPSPTPTPFAALVLSLSGAPSDSFSPTCTSQIPSYIDRYDDFKAKGVSEIYVVAVNDVFVVNAWKKQMLKEANKEWPTSVKFGKSIATLFI
jgi:peroxiredoxin